MSKAVGPGQHGASSQNYVYTRLADLNAPVDRINVWAVVKYFKETQRSRGSDYFQTFSLVDDSLDPRDQTAKLMCTLFGRELKMFPTIGKIGDVLRLHRINVKPARDGETSDHRAHSLSKLQAMSTFGFAWVIVDGDPNSDLKPRSTANEFTWTEADRARADELRQWFFRNHAISSFHHPPPGTNLPPLPQQAGQIHSPSPVKQPGASSLSYDQDVKWIDSVVLNNYFNVPVLLIGMGVKSSDRCVLFATDGSMTSQRYARLLPPFATINPTELVSLKMDQDLYDQFTKYMVPIVIFDDHCQTAQALKPGDCVFLKNLHCVAAKTQGLAAGFGNGNRSLPCVELVLHGKTHFGRGIRKMDPHEPLARKLTERIEVLKMAHAEAEEQANLSMASRSIADQSMGPFADLLHVKSRHHQSPPTTPQNRTSPRRQRSGGDVSPATTPAKVAKKNTSNSIQEELGENDDEWEIVKMRDVATQTNFPPRF